MLNRLFGQVTFCIRGSGGEQLLSRAVRQGISLHTVRRSQNEITATVRGTAYRRLLSLRHGLNCTVRIRKKRGLPFFLHRYRHHWGIPVGLVLFFAVLRLLSAFVWQVEIAGETALPPERILKAAAELGISVGSPLSAVRPEQNSTALQMALPELSWASVNVQGCRVRLQVHDRIPTPAVVPKDEPCNLIARCNGVITRVQTERGIETVKPGQTVLRGAMLVSGVFEDSVGETLLFHAKGRIFARTVSEETISVSLLQTEQVPTGNTRKRIHWRIFGAELPFSWTAKPKSGEWLRTVTKEPLRCFGTELPLCRLCETWTEVQSVRTELTQAEALALAEEKLKSRIGTDYADRTVLEVRKKASCSGRSLCLKATVICEENIAEEAPIRLEK